MTTTKPVATQHPLSDDSTHPLRRMQRALRANLTRVWPTRNLPLCPPAHAGLAEATSLDTPGLLPGPALTVFLPAAFEPYVQALAGQPPRVVVHPDLSLERQHAYLSWSAPAEPGKLPLTAWVKLDELTTAIPADGDAVFQVVVVAGGSVGVGGFTLDKAFRARCREALAECEVAPTGYTVQELTKAKAKATAYSDRPWLFMAYELRSGGTRMAVNWAPVRRMRSTTAA